MQVRLNSEIFNAILYNIKNLISIYKMYVTLKFDDNGCCRIHSISDRDKEIVTNERYVVMPWKMVTRKGKNISLKEVVDGIFSHQESEMNEHERRERKKKLRVSVRNTMRPIWRKKRRD